VSALTTDRRRRVGYALVALAASGWGTWPLVLGRAPMPAALQSGIVMAVVTLVSLPMMLRDRVAKKATLGQWAGIAWLGVADAMNIVLFFAAYQTTTVAISVLTHYLTPIFVALAAPVVLREKARVRTLAAVAVSFAGLVLLLDPFRVGLSRADAIGAALGAGSAVFYASNVLVTKRLSPVFSGAELMFFHGLVAVPLLFALVPAGDYARVDPRGLVVVGTAAIFIGALGGLSFVWGLRRIPASHASVLTLLEPFVAVLLATAFLGQPLGALPLLGAVLILLGGLAVVSGPPPVRGRPPISEPPPDRLGSTS
jgi:drug/metabolite transporter (DMT)-like permease